MNAPATSLSRRRFITRLFSESRGDTGLVPLDDLRVHTDGILWAALAITDSEYFVAGDDGMVFRHDGESWSSEVFPSRLPIHALCTLGDRIFSVGWLGQICERIEGDWCIVGGGDATPGHENLPLFAAASDDAGHLWAVGDQGRVTRFNGSSWTELDCGSNSNLRAVLPLTEGRLLVAGNGGEVRLLDQSGWRKIESGTGCTITSMVSLGDDLVIAVGGEYDVDAGRFCGRVFLFQDGRWQPVEAESPLPRLRRVRRVGDSLVICGDEGAVFRWDTNGVRRLTTRARYDLHDVICVPGDDLQVCGDGGTLLQEAALGSEQQPDDAGEVTPWEVISRDETRRTLRGIWAIGDDRLIAAGDSGVVLHIDGDRVTTAEIPGGLSVHGIWGSSPRNVFAACDNATILHFDGDRWSVAHEGNLETALLAITGFGPHDIFAVGDNGYCLRYDGLMWRQLETGVQQEVYALWGQDSQHLLAVGGGGIVLRFNGETWKTFSAGTDHDLYGVSGSGLDKLFLCGLNGTLIRFENNAWQRDYAGVRSDLHALTHCNGVFYGVGSSGTSLRNSDGLWEVEQTPIGVTLQSVAATETGVYACGADGTIVRRRS